ncbi:Metapyrocatechase [Bienertia sinuspersici]
MAKPARTLKELAAPRFNPDLLCITYADDETSTYDLIQDQLGSSVQEYVLLTICIKHNQAHPFWPLFVATAVGRRQPAVAAVAEQLCN